MWGATQIDLEALRSVGTWFQLSEGQQMLAGSRILQISLILTTTSLAGEAKPLETMDQSLTFLYPRNATDPRDKVYAFLDLLENCTSAALFKELVDYRKSVLQVYVDATTASMQESTGLKILSITNLNHTILAARREDGWPSWVPDLKYRPGPTTLTGYCYFPSACHSEADDRLTKVKIVEFPTVNNHYSFTTTGFVVDKISAISHFCSHPETFANIPRPLDLYAYISAAWRVTRGSVSVVDFAQAIMCSNAPF